MAGGKKGSKGKALMKERQTKKRGGSSSSAPQFAVEGSEVWFSSKNELTQFQNVFAKRAIAPPRYLPKDYPTAKYEHIEGHLGESRLWEFVTSRKYQYNADFIRAFYCTLRRDDDVLYAHVNGVAITMTLEEFGMLANLPHQGEDISSYRGNHWLTNHEATLLNELGFTEVVRNRSRRPTINPEYRVIFYLLTRVIKPRIGNHTTMSVEDEKVLHAIIHGAPINWARFALMHMSEYASPFNEHPLPYAFLVLDILMNASVDPCVGAQVPHSKVWAISDATFRAGPSEEARRPIRAEGSRARRPAATLDSIADSIHNLQLCVTGMGRAIERIDTEVQRQGHSLRSYFARVNYSPPPYHTTFQGHNFENESDDDDEDFDENVDSDPMDVEDDEEEEVDDEEEEAFDGQQSGDDEGSLSPTF